MFLAGLFLTPLKASAEVTSTTKFSLQENKTAAVLASFGEHLTILALILGALLVIGCIFFLLRKKIAMLLTGAALLLLIPISAYALTTQSSISLVEGPEITSITGADLDFGIHDMSALGHTMQNESPISITISDQADKPVKQWTLALKADPVTGDNGQVCHLSDYKIDINLTQIQRIDHTTGAKTAVTPLAQSNYSSVADSEDWESILEVAEGESTADYIVTFEPGGIVLLLCNDLLPNANYSLTTHWELK
jgi:hypothetical protein